MYVNIYVFMYMSMSMYMHISMSMSMYICVDVALLLTEVFDYGGAGGGVVAHHFQHLWDVGCLSNIICSEK
jgi:hypothetical protein